MPKGLAYVPGPMIMDPNPGTSAIGRYRPAFGSTNPSVPAPTRRPRAGRRTTAASPGQSALVATARTCTDDLSY